MDKSVPGSEREPTPMKRNMKRLTLNRETVRHLDAEEMSAAQGGAGSVDICPIPTAYAVCVTHTCPTKCGQWYCYGV